MSFYFIAVSLENKRLVDLVAPVYVDGQASSKKTEGHRTGFSPLMELNDFISFTTPLQRD